MLSAFKEGRNCVCPQSALGWRGENAWKQRCQPKGSKSCERVAGCWCCPARAQWPPRVPGNGRVLRTAGLNHHPRGCSSEEERSEVGWGSGSSEKCKCVVVKQKPKYRTCLRRVLGTCFKAGTCAVEKLAATW